MPATISPRTRFLRAVLALSGLVSLTAGLVLLAGAPSSLAASSHKGHGGSAVTVRGPKMWDPAKGKPFPQRSTVTVGQTRDLVNQSVRVSWTGFTPTNFEGQPPYDSNATAYPVMLAECKGTHPTINQCYGATDQGQAATYGKYGAFNTQYEVTQSTGKVKGTGFGTIDIETISQNNGLGCETGHPCSLVVVPAQGGNISRDNNTSGPFTCQNHSNDDAADGTANAFHDFGGDNTSCSWDERIVVSLRFAPTASACPNRATALSVAGSPMMNAAMTQWDSGLCSGSQPIAVTYFGNVPESQAITEVLGGQDQVALTTLPSTVGTAGGNRHYTYAPIGIGAETIGYWADNPNTSEPQTGMRLNPRLVAKLITLSYDLEEVSCSLNGHQKGCDPGIGPKNAQDFFLDPEFTKLNPHLQPATNSNQYPAVPMVLQSESDMTSELTRWIAANPDADAFVKGTPDHWGMRVNKYFKGVILPTSSFPTNDPSIFISNAYSPVQSLTGPNSVTQDLALGAAPGDQWFLSCPAPEKVCPTRFNQELQGQRDLYAVMDSGDSATYQLPTAALLNAAGRYVEPTKAAMAAALRSMVTAKNGITQQVNLNSKNPAAYPLTMVVYAMVPTSGVSKADGALIARWLRYVVGAAQTPGQLPGQLAPGYLPLPQRLRAETLSVANKVAAQTPPAGSISPTPTTSSPASSSTSPTSSPSAGSLSPSASQSSGIGLPTATPTLSTVAVRDPVGSGLTRYALPLLLIIGGLAALGGAAPLIAGSSLPSAIRTRLRAYYTHGPKRWSSK
jgi:hypothetical protein